LGNSRPRHILVGTWVVLVGSLHGVGSGAGFPPAGLSNNNDKVEFPGLFYINNRWNSNACFSFAYFHHKWPVSN